MSEELPTIIEEEEELPDSPPKKEKNPNRVKQGFKLAAIGQKARGKNETAS